MPDDERQTEAEEVAAIIRAGLWALFAASSLNRQFGGPTQAASDADQLLDKFNARFPLEELLL